MYHIFMYIYIYIYIYVCVCMCVCVSEKKETMWKIRLAGFIEIAPEE